MSEQKLNVRSAIAILQAHDLLSGKLAIPEALNDGLIELLEELEQLRAELAELKKAQGEPAFWVEPESIEGDWAELIELQICTNAFKKRHISTGEQYRQFTQPLYTAPQPAAAIDENSWQFNRLLKTCRGIVNHSGDGVTFLDAQRDLQIAVADCASYEREREHKGGAKLNAQPAPAVPEGLIDALKHQWEVDQEGVECAVSSEAVNMAISILEALAAAPEPTEKPAPTGESHG